MAVDVIGDEKLIDRFEAIQGRSFKTEIIGVMEENANEIVKEAKSKAPGSLPKGIEVVRDDKFGPAALIQFTNEKYYGMFPEYGTEMQSEQAFIRESAAGKEGQVTKSVKEKIEEKLSGI